MSMSTSSGVVQKILSESDIPFMIFQQSAAPLNSISQRSSAKEKHSVCMELIEMLLLLRLTRP